MNLDEYGHRSVSLPLAKDVVYFLEIYAESNWTQVFEAQE